MNDTTHPKAAAVAPINEAVNLLGRFAPQVLADLRRDHPELAPHLQEGGIAGVLSEQVAARADVSLATLREAIALCNIGVENAQGRLRAQKRMVLIGGITSTVASASVIATLAAEYRSAAFISGVVALFGSLATVLAEHFGRVPKQGVSLYDAYRTLVNLRTDAQLLLRDLSSRLDGNPQDEDEREIARLVGKSNALFREVNEWLTVLEISASAEAAA